MRYCSPVTSLAKYFKSSGSQFEKWEIHNKSQGFYYFFWPEEIYLDNDLTLSRWVTML